MLFSALFLLSSLVYAAPCQVLKAVDTDTTLPTFIVNSGTIGVITIVSVPTVPAEVRAPIAQLFSEDETNLARTSLRAVKLLDYYHEALAGQAALLAYLHDRMTKVQVATLVVDWPAEDIGGLDRFANNLYLQAFQTQVRAHSSDSTLDRLILIAVGAPMYAKLADPASFRLTKIEGMTFSEEALATQPEQPPAKLAPKKKARIEKPPTEDTRESDAYQRARDRLRGQASSLETFAHLRERIRGGEFRGKSLEAVKEQVLAGYWRKARGPVSDYLDEALVSDKGKIKNADEDLIEHLLAKRDRTLVFATSDHYEYLKNEFRKACR